MTSLVVLRRLNVAKHRELYLIVRLLTVVKTWARAVVPKTPLGLLKKTKTNS